MLQDTGGQWGWKGSTSAYDGALVKDIFDAFEKIEFDIDWQWAQNHHGPDTNSTHMPRTAAQWTPLSDAKPRSIRTAATATTAA